MFQSVIFFLICNNLAAQSIDSTLGIYAERFFLEKIHLQIDRSEYKKGETIFYKAYLLENNDFPSLSKSIYVDWYDEIGKVVQQTKSPLILSGAAGSFDIPLNYKGNFIYLRAYTNWMLNFDTAFIYNRSIRIRQPGVNIESAAKTEIRPLTNVHLYPEGGFAIQGVTNCFAFKAVDQWGDPAYIKASVVNRKGELLDSVRAQHDGMGKFSIKLKHGEEYYFNWKDEKGNNGSIALPAQKQFGACLKIIPSSKKALFIIERSLNAGSEFETMHLLVHCHYSLRYKIDINMILKTSISSEIMLDSLPTGIVQFTLFNDNWIPVAERIIFVSNKTRDFVPQISVLEKDLSYKGLNKIEIVVTDTLLTNMSAAVTEASLAYIGSRDIFYDFLFNGEIQGEVNNINYYFPDHVQTDMQSKEDKVRDSILAAHLDLVMLTNGHRRYNWEQIAKGEIPEIQYPADAGYMQIKGKLTAKRLRRSKEQLFLNIILQPKDGLKKVFALPVNDEGNFESRYLIYYDTSRLFYELNSVKNISGSVSFENNTLTDEKRTKYFKSRVAPTTLLNRSGNDDKNNLLTDTFFYTLQDIEAKKLTGTKVLKEVVVTSKTKTARQILDDYYTSGLYAGESNNYAIDVEGDITSSRYRDIFSYLQTRVPGLRVEYPSGGSPVPVWYPNSQGIPGVPDFLLDEVPVTLESLNSLDINSIAYVKAFKPPFLGSLLNGFSGVIAIYSKRGSSPIHSNESSIPGLEQNILIGYTKFKEFTQPDYTATKEKPDHRSTLYWNPYLLTDKNNNHATIQFYNNDISKKLCLIIEGINSAGGLARVIKILE